MIRLAACDTSKDESKDPGIALNINVAESIELLFQMVVSFGSRSSKAATASRVKCAAFFGFSRVIWAVDYLCLKGWAVAKVFVEQIFSIDPYPWNHSIECSNRVVEFGREGRISEEQGRGEPLRDYVSWISPKSPSPFFQNLVVQSLIGLIFVE